jgi:4-hydroxybenzoate polyprenyltransferase
MTQFPDIKISTPPTGRLQAYMDLIRIRRPIGIYLLMWPPLWALWIAAEGRPDWRLVLIFMLGAVLMRSAGCAINDFADRGIDGRVDRTRQRPLATGAIKPGEALAIFVLLSLAAFSLVLLLDPLTIAMSVVAVALAALYPFMKRFTHLPQLVLGMAFGWAIPMAFTAVTGTVPLAGWLLYLAAVIWALIYDTEYAMVDRDDDLKIGVKSTAILFGHYDRAMIALLQVLMLALLLGVGLLLERGGFFYLGLCGAIATVAYQQWLISGREPKRCFDAFLNNNWFGMFIFVGLLLDYP